MRDLEIWSGEPSPEALAELSRWPLARRAPYLGRLRALLDRDPPLHAAALRALAGATGVEGVRAIVHALAAPEPEVSTAALDALRVTAREAPHRYAHAVFHPSVEVRRAALVDIPQVSAGLAIYLRADPACADLTSDAAWPKVPLPLAVDLYATGKLRAGELLEVALRVETAELTAFLATEQRRSTAQLDGYLATLTTAATLVRAPGHDILDLLVAALAEAFLRGTPFERQLADRVLEQRLIAPKKPAPVMRRILASLFDHLAVAPQRPLIEAAIACEPTALAYPAIGGLEGLAEAAIAGLFRYRWPVRLLREQVERLLALPRVRGDLALAVAVVGLGGARLKRLRKLLGEAEIVGRLVASDRGWDELCRLPQETPALELAWLAKIEQLDPARYVALAGRALGVLREARLATFVDQIPRRHREAAVLAFLAGAELDEAHVVTAIPMLAHRLDRAAITSVLATLLAGDHARRTLARALARELPDKLLAAAATGLDDVALSVLVELCDGPDALPRDRELALAEVIAHRPAAAIQAWVARVREVAPAVELPAPRVPIASALDETQRHRIATCADSELPAALAPALAAPVTGLVAALGARLEVASVSACAALIGCADPIESVTRELERFSDPTPRFADRLDHAVATHWNRGSDLPVLAHARLYRWEAHTFALTRWIDEVGGTLAAVMFANALPGSFAVQTMWRGIAEVVMFWRFRDPPRLLREGTVDLARYCASRVDRPIGRHAARILVALLEARVIRLSSIKDILLDRTADADVDTREQLARLIRLEGMPEPPPRLDARTPTAELVEQIKSCRDLAELERWCGDVRPAVVQEAVLTLLVLGELGQLRLAGLLPRLHEVIHPIPILASITLWDHPQALLAARELAARGATEPSWQFHLCLGLGDREGALAAAARPGGWFRREDWDALIAVVDPVRCALELADCPHHHAYQHAIALLRVQPASPAVRDAMMRFLAVSADRPLHLRRTLAWILLTEYRVELGLPLVIEELVEGPGDEGDPLAGLPHSPRIAELVATAVVEAALIGGHHACSEKRMWHVLEALRPQLAADTASALASRILEQASTPAVRRQASQLVIGELTRAERLSRVAEVFAWGVRRGIELTGRLFRIHLTSKETDLGHTFLEGNRIFVSPLPLLRGEPFGRDIVEGLLLHEIGHHAYHRGEEPQALWKQAHDEGLGHLLNLIADEHLERNLRGVDRTYGDRLKRLDAYAFQHGAHEIAVDTLLDCLRGSAAAALTGTPLEVAFDDASVRLRRGAVLIELERNGHPLARFARALRMGLGNRTGDPLVAQALALCGSHLKQLDMRGLYDLTVEIAALFGGSVAVAKVFGGPEGLEFGEREDDVFGGFDDDILQREVERILDPRRNKSTAPGGRDRLCINVNPGEGFDRITHVERVTGDPKHHRETAQRIARHAHRLRAFLDELGLRWQPQRARIQGRALDRTRLRGLVTRGDPRILVAREPVRRTDLFLGTLIDCSGSMSAGDNIERAQRFAVMIAEAVQPLAGVEARFFGFTDSVIYDAGDARDCAVTGLSAGGGNNDAAALFHAANVAARSPKRAKVLVMISDGLPTECSVAALRGLVTTLTRRRGLVCAQVAVRRLEEECFPHHVLLDDHEPDVAVARFGRMIADLARRGLAQ